MFINCILCKDIFSKFQFLFNYKKISNSIIKINALKYIIKEISKTERGVEIVIKDTQKYCFMITQ